MPTLSLCMIVRDVAPYIERALASVAAFVDEFVFVDTGSTDDTKAVIRRFCEGKPLKILDFNPENRPQDFLQDDPETWDNMLPGPYTGSKILANFAAARNLGWDAATSDFLMWIDSDDVVEHGERLPAVLQAMNRERVDTGLLNYDYGYDKGGNVVCKLQRERILRRSAGTLWGGVIHECLGNVGLVKFYGDVNIAHRREHYGDQIKKVHYRNLKVLLRWWKEHQHDETPDARMLFYFGNECKPLWPEKSIEAYKRYCRISGWDEERAIAHLQAGRLHEDRGEYDEAKLEYAQAVLDAEFNPEPYFGAARVAYFKRDWRKCCEWTERGLRIRAEHSTERSLMMFDPLERFYRPYIYYSAALVNTQRYHEAIAAANEGLKWNPHDPHLKGNKEFSEKQINTPQDQETSMSIAFKMSDPLDTPPQDIPLDARICMAVQLWKSLVGDKLYERALQFIDSLPDDLVTAPKIREARELTITRRNNPPGIQTVERESGNEKVRLSSSAPPLKIIIWTGPGWEVWTPASINKGGIGGSETAAVKMAEEFSLLGHDVTVFSECGERFKAGGVQYIPWREAENNTKFFICDIFVCSRQPGVLAWGWPAKKVYVWVHDIHLGGDTSQFHKVDKFFCLSHWHKQFFIDTYKKEGYEIDPERVVVTRNGIDVTRFAPEPEKKGNKLIYSSSADRGLERLLDLFPRIREEVPDAELHIYYGFDNWKKAAAQGQQYGAGSPDMDKIRALEASIASSPGVIYHGRVGQDELARAFLEAKVWAYPTWFTETYCQLPGSLVFTNDGMKPIEDVREGDQVLTHKGRFRSVKGLVRKDYKGALYSIKRKKDFHAVTVTREHPLRVATFHQRGDATGKRVYNDDHAELVWLPPTDIRPDLCYLVSPKMTFGTRVSIKLSDYIDMPVQDGMVSSNHNNSRWNKVENVVSLDDELAYILGLFAAEGCVVKSRARRARREWMSQIIFALNVKERSIADRILKFFGKGTVRQTSDNGMTVAVHNSPWANLLDGVIGRKRAKRVPSFIWEAPQEIQAAFINGLFDGDGNTTLRDCGHVYKPYFRYTTISPSLAYGMAQLLANQGLYAGVTFDEDRHAYNLNWTPEPGTSVQHREVCEGFATRVKNIEVSEYEGVVYNIDVEEDESYVTDRTIVHNCIGAIEAQAAGCVPITSNLAALSETVQHGILLTEPNTTDVYADAFVKDVVLLLTNEGTRKLMAEPGRKWALERCSWGSVAKEWEQEFLGALGRTEKAKALGKQAADFIRKTIEAGAAMERGDRPDFKDSSGADIDFVMNPNTVYPWHGVRAFDPKNLCDAPRGLSGTDLNFFGSAFALARKGKRVRVFAPLTEPLVTGGVEFHQFVDYKNIVDPSPVAIAHYDMSALADSKSPFNIAVQHTFDLPAGEFYKTGKINLTLCTSRHTLKYLRNTYGHQAPGMAWNYLPNANDMGDFKPVAPVPGRMIFATSPERGLHLLLEAFPEIKRRCPRAHIVFIGALDHLDQYHLIDARHASIAARIKEGLERCKEWVTIIPRSSRNTVLAELAKASVFAYPCDPPIPCEVAPNSIMDALRAGVPVVLKPDDGIAELYEADEAVWVEYLADGAYPLDPFIDAVAKILNGTRLAQVFVDGGKRMAARHTFDAQADDLLRLVEEHRPKSVRVVGNMDEALEGKELHFPVEIVSRKPKISINLGSKRPGGIDITLAGLVNQSFKDFEVIFVDGRYHLRHKQVLEAVKRSGLKQPFYHVPNHRYRDDFWGENCAGFNTGFMLSEGEFVVFLMDYAFAPPGWLEAHVKHQLQGPKVIIGPHEYRVLKNVKPKPGPELKTFERPGAECSADALRTILAQYERFDEISAFDRPFTADQIDQFPNEHIFALSSKPTGPHDDWGAFATKNESFPLQAVLDVNGMNEVYDRGRGPGDPDLGYRLVKSGLPLWVVHEAVLYCMNPRGYMPNPSIVIPDDRRFNGYTERFELQEGYRLFERSKVNPRAENPYDLRVKKPTIWHWRELSQRPEVLIPRNVVPDNTYWNL